MTFPDNTSPRIRQGRWRLRLTPGPVQALLLTQTPDPNCRYCDGEGGWLTWPRSTRYVTCVCWDPTRARRLLRLRRP
ncbi:hypothetical protein [Kitasatospora cheerisanensis]|uniref:Uncharacterized protein n=1 Tax=Kitasatospora cheerisanensis KCTC 2395 TaxID=1348663 RepID=A0A066Z0G4_9ACTN|nr:hypothetical protein [Kitasatospora cheerisanensis]KDN85709.1 hypothetical protein KCH_25370 [Kitasatospora cheerisanensis KCTC 2395]